MSTAHEIQAKISQAKPRWESAAKAMMQSCVVDTIMQMHGREVCVRRARKLRKRGELVRWSHNTSKGKGRFLWAKRIKWTEAPTNETGNARMGGE